MASLSTSTEAHNNFESFSKVPQLLLSEEINQRQTPEYHKDILTFQTTETSALANLKPSIQFGLFDYKYLWNNFSGRQMIVFSEMEKYQNYETLKQYKGKDVILLEDPIDRDYNDYQINVKQAYSVAEPIDKAGCKESFDYIQYKLLNHNAEQSANQSLPQLVYKGSKQDIDFYIKDRNHEVDKISEEGYINLEIDEKWKFRGEKDFWEDSD